MGAVFAPMVGAMAADYSRHRGEWPGPRRDVNQAGLVAWVVGLAVGMVPTIARSWGQGWGEHVQPAAVFAFVVAFLTYLILAGIGAESPPVVLAEAGANAENP